MAVGCPFITCAVKKKGIEFCWDCTENITCEKWKKHREAGKKIDSFKCYQKLEEDISFIQKKGISEFEKIRWTCSQCGGTICVHRGYCYNCGKNYVKNH